MKGTKNNPNDGSGGRLKEILAVLVKHRAARGLSPERLRAVMEDLGPTFIKLGQIMSMRRDMLPDAYCHELRKLRTDVAPMPLAEVRRIIASEYGRPLEDVFSSFDPIPLGSASIAQVHAAVLTNGRQVVVKVQRPNIHSLMARDVALLHQAAGLLHLTPLGGVVDFDMVLDEMWHTARQEMDFLLEAQNADEFRTCNQDVTFACCPKIEHAFTTVRVLVMEYISGIAIDDTASLHEQGYDLTELGRKLADHYVKQVVDDGFFHADPHPGNLCIRGGKIAWLDLGMMGRLSARDQVLIRDAVRAFAESDADALRTVVLALGVCEGTVDQEQLYSDLDGLMVKYSRMALGRMDLGEMMNEFLSLARKHCISMPGGVTMLARGMVTLEGTLAAIDPDLDLMEILKARVKAELAGSFLWKEELADGAQKLYRSGKKAVEVPGQVSDLLRAALKGHAKLNLNLSGADKPLFSIERMVNRVIKALLACAFLLGGCLLTLSGASPTLPGAPLWAPACFIAALILTVQVLWEMRRGGKPR